MTEIEQLKKELEDLKIRHQVLLDINKIQAERLLQWQTKLESREVDKEINELARGILNE